MTSSACLVDTVSSKITDNDSEKQYVYLMNANLFRREGQYCTPGGKTCAVCPSKSATVGQQAFFPLTDSAVPSYGDFSRLSNFEVSTRNAPEVTKRELQVSGDVYFPGPGTMTTRHVGILDSSSANSRSEYRTAKAEGCGKV